jgi:enoyl-[acyl-carrier-protein] reductase (NADH)
VAVRIPVSATITVRTVCTSIRFIPSSKGVNREPLTLGVVPTTVEEVANMVVYVASPLASGTTGAALRVDGGVIDTL